MNSCFLLELLRDRSFSNELNLSEFVPNFLCNIGFKWGEIPTTDDAGRTGKKNERTAALPNSEATAKER